MTLVSKVIAEVTLTDKKNHAIAWLSHLKI